MHFAECETDAEGTPDMFDFFDQLIPAEALNALPSPCKASCFTMGCNSPISNLMNVFHPSDFSYYVEKLELTKQSQIHKNAFDYVKNMSPASLYSSLLSSMTNNSVANEAMEIQGQPQRDECNETYYRSPVAKIKTEKNVTSNSTSGYPGSMLHHNSAPEHDISVLDSFIENSNDEGEEHETNEKYLHPDDNHSYFQEVIDQNQQNGWSPAGNHYIGYTNSVLYPHCVPYPGYYEGQYNHDDVQTQTFLPMYFKSNSTPLQALDVYVPLSTDDINNPYELNDKTDDNTNSSSFSKGGSSSKTAEELLNKCKEALNPENWGLKLKKSPHSTTIHSNHQQNLMKYLEEAANDILPNDVVKRERKILPDNLMKPEKKVKGPKGQGDKPGKYECKDCKRTFNRQYTLNTHQRIHRGEKPYVCEICGVGFRQSGTKLNHIRAVHTKDRPFECPYCGKTFSHKSSITVHIRIHTNEKPYECEHCPRRFTDRATYLKHQSIHTGVKPYTCPICTKCFSQKSNLKRHFKNIHQDEGESPLK